MTTMDLEGNVQTIAASSHAISRDWALFTKRFATRWKSKRIEQALFSLSPVGDCNCRFCNASALAGNAVVIARSPNANRNALQHRAVDIASSEYHSGNDNEPTNAGRAAGTF